MKKQKLKMKNEMLIPQKKITASDVSHRNYNLSKTSYHKNGLYFDHPSKLINTSSGKKLNYLETALYSNSKSKSRSRLGGSNMIVNHRDSASKSRSLSKREESEEKNLKKLSDRLKDVKKGI